MSRTVKRSEAAVRGRVKCPSCGRLIAVVRPPKAPPMLAAHRDRRRRKRCRCSESPAWTAEELAAPGWADPYFGRESAA
jgi:hypothetical protein